MVLRILTSFVILVFQLTPFVGLSQPAVTPEAGVSRTLAMDRAKILRNIRYNLDFTIPGKIADPVMGKVDITLECLDISHPLQIDFKAARNQILEFTVQDSRAPIDFREEHLVVPAHLLRKGEMHLHISFIAGGRPLNRSSDFLYSLLVPDRARTLFPCFDQPDLKAVYTLTLTLPDNWKALGNAPVRDSIVNQTAGIKTLHFLPSDLIPTYLFSFAAGKFFMAEEEREGRWMHAFYRETDSVKIKLSLDSLFRIQQQALDFLKDYTHIPFPFQKFDFVAIPDFQFGGMEHPGAIQYKASSLFLDSGATREQLNGRVSLLSHETAHIWFGDLVTMQWFNDVWMKEVFANFMADKVSKTVNAGANFDLKFLTDHYPAAYAIDRSRGANPIRQKLENLQDAGSMYGNIIYHKAPIMMRQLELMMGEVPFRNGLRKYLQTYSFGNASWPELISILKKNTASNLDSWNNAWVNEPGRPVFSYHLESAAGKINKLVIVQGEKTGNKHVLPQVFSITLVYPDHSEVCSVRMLENRVELIQLKGKPLPQHILFNSDGYGYGVFPVDTSALNLIASFESPVARAAAYINTFENMLDGRALHPVSLIRRQLLFLQSETEELNLGLLIGQVQSIYWHFIDSAGRLNLTAQIEELLWKTMQSRPQANEKKQLFLAYAGLASSAAALDTLYQVWKNRQPPTGVKLSEEDYSSLACGLALRGYSGYEKILTEQTDRIQNPDRKARFLYLIPALSASQVVRDSVFYSFRDPKNRSRESWVLGALGYLQHPLRISSSEKYLEASLEWLSNIQKTGDVFFPGSWLQANFGNYQSPAAAALVERFLKDHPNYNTKLKEKILQATDNLFRAQLLLKESYNVHD